MAKQANNKTDALFRQKLENFEVNPPEASWERIQGQISSPSPYTGLVKYSFLAILLLFTVGVSYMAITLPTLNNNAQATKNQTLNTNQSSIAATSNDNKSTNNLTQTLQNKLVDVDASKQNDIINSSDQKSLISQFVSNIFNNDEADVSQAENDAKTETILATVQSTQSNIVNNNQTAKFETNQSTNTNNGLLAVAKTTANIISDNHSPINPVNSFDGWTSEQITNPVMPATSLVKEEENTPISLALVNTIGNQFGASLLPPMPTKGISAATPVTLEEVKVPDFYPSQLSSNPRFHFGAMHLLSHTWRTSALDDVYLQNQADDYKKNFQLGNSLGFLMGITTPKRWMFEAQFIFFSRQATEFTYIPDIGTSVGLKVPEVTINLRYLHLPVIAKKQFNLIPAMPNLLTLGIFAGPQFTMLKSGVVTTLDGNKTDNTYRSYEIGAIAGTDVEIGIVKNLRFRLGFNTMATNKPQYLFKPKQNSYSMHSGLTSAITYQF